MSEPRDHYANEFAMDHDAGLPDPTPDAKGEVLLDIGYGPDRIKLYTNKARSTINNASPNSLYVDVSTTGAFTQFGPMLDGVREKLIAALKSTVPAVAEATLVTADSERAIGRQHVLLKWEGKSAFVNTDLFDRILREEGWYKSSPGNHP